MNLYVGVFLGLLGVIVHANGPLTRLTESQMDKLQQLLDKWSDEEERLAKAVNKCPNRVPVAAAKLGLVQEFLRDLKSVAEAINFGVN